MIVYLIILTILIGLAFLGRATMSAWWDWIGIAILILFAGTRFEMGADYMSYQAIYAGKYTPGQVESGYLAIQNFLGGLHIPFEAFTLLWAAVSLVLYCIFVRQYFRPAIIPIAYYFARFYFLRDMGQIRAAMVCTICMLSISLIIKKQPVFFTIVVLLASLIHISALFFLLAYPFYVVFKRINLKWVCILLGAAFLAGTVSTQILAAVVVRVLPRYAPYVTNPAYVGGSLFDPVTLMHVLICIAGFYVLEHLDVAPAFIRDKEIFRLLLMLYFLAALTLLGLARLSTISGRLSTIYSTLETILVPTIIYSVLPKYARTICVAAAVGFIFVLIFIVSGTFHQYIPYQSFL